SRAGVGDQLAQVGVVGGSELCLDDDESGTFVAGGEVDPHAADGLFVAGAVSGGPPFADHDFPSGVFEVQEAQAGCELIEIVGQPVGKVGFSGPQRAGVADDLVAGLAADASAEDALRRIRIGHEVTACFFGYDLRSYKAQDSQRYLASVPSS